MSPLATSLISSAIRPVNLLQPSLSSATTKQRKSRALCGLKSVERGACASATPLKDALFSGGRPKSTANRFHLVPGANLKPTLKSSQSAKLLESKAIKPSSSAKSRACRVSYVLTSLEKVQALAHSTFNLDTCSQKHTRIYIYAFGHFALR